MNKQGKNGISWCTYTWNPISGCYGPGGTATNPKRCPYCYAQKIANRFSKHTGDNEIIGINGNKIHEVYPTENIGDPYPWGFEPTLHWSRLDDPRKVKKPQRIFVCSMADLFGPWIPEIWQHRIFEACDQAPWHKYLFLTKSPYWYKPWYEIARNHPGWWFGTTITNNLDFKERIGDFLLSTTMNNNPIQGPNRFISFEPLHEDLSQRILDYCMPYLDFIIIGQETGNRKGKVIPKDEWVQNIIDQCREHRVPVFIKQPLYNKFPIQEYPEGLRLKPSEKDVS